jgi:hypothetical protein
MSTQEYLIKLWRGVIFSLLKGWLSGLCSDHSPHLGSENLDQSQSIR